MPLGKSVKIVVREDERKEEGKQKMRTTGLFIGAGWPLRAHLPVMEVVEDPYEHFPGGYL